MPLEDELPIFEVTVEIEVTAKSYDDAMEWTADFLEVALKDDQDNTIVVISARALEQSLED